MLGYAATAFQYFQGIGVLLPATAVVALILFAAREGLEFHRRRGADRRKKAAIKHFIGREIELLQGAIRSFRYALQAFKNVDDGTRKYVRVYTAASGGLRYESWDEGDDNKNYRSGGAIADVVDRFDARFMLEVANLDNDLYKNLEPAVDEIATLKHVRNGFIEYAEDEDFRGGFTGYANRELDDIEVSFKSLYRYCTGRDEVPARLR